MRKPRSLYTTLLSILGGILFLLLATTETTAILLYRNNVLTTSNQNLQTTGEQLLGTYDSYFSQILRNSDAIIYSYNSIDDEGKFGMKMNEYFSNILALREEVISLSLYKASSGEKIAYAGNVKEYANVKEEKWFQETFQTEENRLIPILTLPEEQNPLYPYSFSLSRYASYDRNETCDAVLHIDFSFDSIVNLLSETALGEGGNFLIYDKDYQIVYSSLPNDLDKKTSILKEFVVGNGLYEIGGHSFFVFASSISNTSWRLGVFLNRDGIKEAIVSFSVTILLIGGALLAIGSLIFFYVIQQSVQPIRLLSKEMSEIVTLEDMPSRRINVQGSKEVVELNDSFKALIERINDLTKKLIHEQEEQRKSELRALQNQINPHFLYNTLDSIIALIDKNQNAEAEKMIVALSRFFRISISKGKNIITLQKEVEHATNYLLIQKLRFGDAFDYSFDIDPTILQTDVVKLILQPIIENSIYHGLKEGEKGNILVKGYKKDDYIYLDVCDNGYGMLEETRKELERSMKDEEEAKGVGLHNVYLRLRVYYGPKADIRIESKLDEGTIVHIMIPLKGEEK